MKFVKRGSTTAVIIFSLILFIPFAQAQQSFDVMCCFSGVITTVSASQELTVFGVEVSGIFQSNHQNKTLDNMTLHCVGIFRVVDGKSSGTSYCKGMDPDGDIVVQEHIRVGQEVTWNFLQGTGKWKGIKGGGSGKAFTGGKPITPGTTQACSRVMGTFELPK